MRRIVFAIFWNLFCCLSTHAQEFNFTKTGLPVCYITTADNTPIESKNEYVPATIRIERDNETILSESAISIRLRGNATITYPKKPYKIKFNKKTVPLPGMSKDKSFALLANFTDRSLMNVAIGFKIGSMLENGWVPQSQFVEVVVNGEHLGTYQLTEDVKRMCTDPEFMKRVALVHQKYGAAIYSEILDFYDVLSDSLQRSQALNFQLWDLLGKPIAYSYVGFDTWEEEVQYSKNFFITHYRWLEEQLKPYLSGDGITETVCRDYHQDNATYTIDGRKLFKAPQQNGLFIRNGRKYLIRK